MAFRRQATAEDVVDACVTAREAVGHEDGSGRLTRPERARPEQVPHRRDQLERFERLAQERIRAGIDRPVALGNRRHRDDVRALLRQLLAQVDTASTGDHEIQHDDRRLALVVEALRLRGVEREDHLAAFGAQQVLRQLRRERVALREQHEHTVALLRRDVPLTLRNPLGQDAVRVRGARARLHRPLDELQLLDLGPGVEPLPAVAAFRDDGPVPFLPRAQRGARDAQHPAHRTDAVDGLRRTSRPITLFALSRFRVFLNFCIRLA